MKYPGTGTTDSKISRRAFTASIWTICLSLASWLLIGCKGGNQVKETFASCDDFSNVPQADLQLRKSLSYTEVSPIEESSCTNCNLWLPSQNDLSCGGCTLFAGPVAAEGYCTYWAPQVDAG